MNQVVTHFNNFINNQVVRDVTYKSSQIVVAGLVGGLFNMAIVGIGSKHDNNCAGSESWKSFKIGFVFGSVLKTAQLAGVFSHPAFTNLAKDLRETHYIKVISDFLLTV